MPRLQVRLATAVLLVAVVALSMALFIQWRREATLRAELAQSRALLARARAQLGSLEVKMVAEDLKRRDTDYRRMIEAIRDAHRSRPSTPPSSQ